MGSGNWYPSAHQLKTPEDTERAMRQVLNKVYELQEKMHAPAPSTATTPAAPTTLSTINGLPVLPFDPATLADGTQITWVAAHRRFEVK
jgi:hypothetical protein